MGCTGPAKLPMAKRAINAALLRPEALLVTSSAPSLLDSPVVFFLPEDDYHVTNV